MSVFSVPVTIGIDEEGIAYVRYGNEDPYTDPEPLRYMIKAEIQKKIEEHQDLIIKEAAEILADKLARTKAVKEKAALIAEAVLEEES